MKTMMIAVNAIIHQTKSAIIVLEPTSAATVADEIAKRTNNVKKL
jgi:predicted phosphoribosyltransferase